LFNILAARFSFEKLRVADLYAGTGSLSYEFVSRGTESLVSVDRNPECIRFIRKTMLELQAPSGIVQVQSDAIRWLELQHTPLDIIVADPPFAETPAERLVELVIQQNLLSPTGLLIIEHSSQNALSAISGFLESRKYGSVTFSFFGGATG
jgi:16S rRNA (guanine(966)-N(2))-methyltransferase RsmD